MCVTELYCSVDDFWNSFKKDWDKHLIDSGKPKREPEPELSPAEIRLLFFRHTRMPIFSAIPAKHFSREEKKLIS